MPEIFEPGTVWLVGAGPGDPDLLTSKAERLIRAADIVFHDALVSDAILELIPEHVARIPVGKRSGRHSKHQSEINALIVSAALAGKRVVRLKGGDPAIFARAAEEIETCARHGIVARICPGITAASAAAASIGASLTLRGLARKLTLVTAHAQAGEPLRLDWAALADPDATIAIYMGKAAAREISAELVKAGLSPATPAIVVESASLPEERVIRTRLDLLAVAAGGKLTRGPAILLIGEAVGRGSGAGSDSLAKAAGLAGPAPLACSTP